MTVTALSLKHISRLLQWILPPCFVFKTHFKTVAVESAALSNVWVLADNLLPAKRDTQFASRLQLTMKYPTVRVCTNRFKNSFIPYALSNFQRHLQSWLCECSL